MSEPKPIAGAAARCDVATTGLAIPAPSTDGDSIPVIALPYLVGKWEA